MTKPQAVKLIHAQQAKITLRIDQIEAQFGPSSREYALIEILMHETDDLDQALDLMETHAKTISTHLKNAKPITSLF